MSVQFRRSPEDKCESMDLRPNQEQILSFLNCSLPSGLITYPGEISTQI